MPTSPLIRLFVRVLRSRRVNVALTTFAVALLMLAVPDLNPVQGELLVLLLTLALALIGGYSVEEAARIARQQPPADDGLRQIIREVVEAALDELLNAPPTSQ